MFRSEPCLHAPNAHFADCDASYANGTSGHSGSLRKSTLRIEQQRRQDALARTELQRDPVRAHANRRIVFTAINERFVELVSR
jgi:hypothetical protein